jgi:ketosteroid isomerase-like protein
MSQERIEILRRSFEGTARGDLATTLRDFDEEVELRLPAEFPGGGTGRGHDHWIKVQAQFEEAFQEISYEPQEFLEGGDQIVAAVRYRGQARHTGISVDMPVYWVYRFRGMKIVRVEVFFDRDEALQAAGLREG